METYRAEFARIRHETATAAPDAGGRTIGDRLAATFALGLHHYIGAPVLLLAVARRRRARAAARSARSPDAGARGWRWPASVFLVIGVLTPVDMRYYLAALPAIAIAAAAAVPQHVERAAAAVRASAVALAGVLICDRSCIARLRTQLR